MQDLFFRLANFLRFSLTLQRNSNARLHPERPDNASSRFAANYSSLKLSRGGALIVLIKL